MKSNRSTFTASISLVALFSATVRAQASSLMKPIFLEPAKVVLEQNFDDGKLTFAGRVFEPAQQTEWKIEDGVLVKYPSPQKFQEKKKSTEWEARRNEILSKKANQQSSPRE